MNINITGRNIDLDQSLKDYIYKKLRRLEDMYSRIMSCDVVLEEEKERRNVEMILNLKRNKIVAKESSTDIFASVDMAYDVVKKQVRRLSGRIGSKRRRNMLKRIMNPMGRSASAGTGSTEPPVEGLADIVKADMFADKPMRPEEAKLELDVLGRNFIMFRNADSGEVNVLYRRNSGQYGLIEPDF